jgi:hypothetical protein
LPDLVTWRGITTIAFALVAAIAALALGLSIPEQFRDFARLQKVRPEGAEAVGAESGIFSQMARLGANVVARQRWQDDIAARR